VSAVELALVPALVTAAGAAGFAAARMRQTSPAGRHPGFATGYPRSEGREPGARRPGPQQQERPAARRRRARRGWRITVTALIAVAAWVALGAYAHMTGYGPLVIALIAAAVTWSRIRPGKARRRA
jgi:hypothetical protein